MRIIDVTMSLDSITDTGNTTTNTIETGDITIKNQNGSNPVDAGSLYFVETGTTWATNIYGFRFNQVGDTNKLQLQSGNLTTVKNLLTFERDSGDVGIGEAVTPVATLHISSSGNDSTTDALFIENGEGTDLFNIDNTGSVSMLQYGSGDRTGTAAYALSVDSSGNIIETAAASGTPTLQQVTDEDNSLTTQITTSAAIVTSAFPSIYSDGNFYITPKTYGAHTASISGFHGVEFQNNSYVRFKDFTGATKALISSAGQAAFGTGSLFSSPPQLHTAGNQSTDPFRATLKTNSTTEVDVFEVDNRGVIKSFFSGSEIGNWSGSIAIVGFDDDPILGDGLTILGGGALTNTTPSYGTTIVGAHAGSSMTNPGFGIVGIGAYALSGVDGSYHTSVGYRAGQDSDGTGNISFGLGAGQSVTGSYNLSLGWKAGSRNLADQQGAGEGNISIGYQAGYLANATSDYNIFVGYNTGYSASFLQGNNTIIGGNLLNGSTETINNTVVIGSYNQERLRISSAGLYTFNSYGSGTHTGTTAYNLAVDSSGNVIEVSPISSPVDGSGTANYVTRWEDTDTLTTSSMYDDGTNVGVGTTSPSEKFHIKDTTTSGVTLLVESDAEGVFAVNPTKIRLKSTGSTILPASDSTIVSNSSNLTFDTSGSLVFQNASSTSMTIRTGGEVGIGVNPSSPGAKLQVFGDTQGDEVLRLSTATLARGLSVTTFAVGSQGNAGVNFDAFWTTDAALSFSTKGTEALYIDGSQNIGINNSSPSAQLEISSSTVNAGNDLFILKSDESPYYMKVRDNGAIWFRGNSTTGTGALNLILQHSGNSDADAVSRFVWDNSAGSNQWGLGQYDENDDLRIHNIGTGVDMAVFGRTSGNITLSGSLQFEDYGGGTHTGTTAYNLAVDSSGNVIEVSPISSPVDGSGTANYVSKWVDTDTLTDSQIFDNGTNVGINTASPSYTLDVNGNINGTSLYLGSSIIHEGDTNTKIEFDTDTINFDTNGSQRMTISSSGDVGIGTTSPSEKLHVNGRVLIDDNFIVGRSSTVDAANKSFRFAVAHYTNTEEPFSTILGSSTNSANIATIGGGSTLANAATTINFYTAANNTTTQGTERMRIDYVGNVGIGTISPSEKLDVDGNIQISGSNLSYQFATGVTTSSTVIASYPSADCDCVFFDYVIKTQTGTNLRAGTVMAVHDGTNVEYTETSTNDIGDTSAFVFVVNILSGNIRLLGSATTGTYDIKTLVRTI